MNVSSNFSDDGKGGTRWYDLFSRGARDWLRHNEKVRDAVRERLPELVSRADVLGGGARRVQVPVRFLEHYRFRLAEQRAQKGVGQGQVSPGDVLRPAGRARERGTGKGAGSGEDGGVEFVLELSIDDIVDWLWEELELPNLQSKAGRAELEDYAREGWDRRGARSRLDRRRSLKESIKRRAVQEEGPAFTDDDLRYRQLVKRERPSFEAVVFFVMDVSASMGTRDRQIAKTFFFWVVQGLRRQYTHLETVFVAHTDRAWEFTEEEFFQVKGMGGTMAASAFSTVLERIERSFDIGRYNVYVFYASDGENFPANREASMDALGKLGQLVNFIGFLEINPSGSPEEITEMNGMFRELRQDGAPAGVYLLHEDVHVWDAIRSFFHEQAQETD